MPLVDSNLQATWDSLYESLDPAGAVVHFQRVQLPGGTLQYVGHDADLLIDALEAVGLQPGQLIGVVGAGFGWMVERWIARGYGPLADGTTNSRIAAIDTSAWIQSHTAGNSQVQIMNADVNASTGRKAVTNAFGLKGNNILDWVITEDVLPILAGTDPQQSNEILPFCSACRQLGTNVAHLITPIYGDGSAQDPRLNWKTMADWKSWVTPDYVVQRGTSNLL